MRIFGTKGAVEVKHMEDWTECRACTGEDVHTLAWRPVKPEPVETNYRKFVTAVVTGKNGDPDFRRAADLQKVLDACFKPEAETALSL